MSNIKAKSAIIPLASSKKFPCYGCNNVKRNNHSKVMSLSTLKFHARQCQNFESLSNPTKQEFLKEIDNAIETGYLSETLEKIMVK